MGAKTLLANLLGSLLLLTIPFVHATSDLIELQNNPFSRPEIKIQPVRQQSRSAPVQAQRETVIYLEATLVSVNGSMVIANGELIAIGEKVEDMKLLEVREGEAVFGKGRKTRTYKVGVAAEN